MAHVAIYPGAFDPITNGHLGIIERGLNVFEELVVAVAINSRKEPFFTVEEREDLIRGCFEGDDRVVVDSFQGLTVDYLRSRGANVILRGLRIVADFEYEMQMANLNRKLAPGIETLFMMTGDEYFFVSSQNVKEIALLGGSIDGLVPPHVGDAFRRKLKGGRP
jgi:pantetheine-phosphate adenylyltransferase